MKDTKNKKIITLCGSTQFKLEFEFVIKKLIKLGWYVHSVEIYGHSNRIYLHDEYRRWLNDIHLWKINRSNAIYVIDVEGYIGESTRAEIEIAGYKNLPVYYYSKGDLIK